MALFVKIDSMIKKTVKKSTKNQEILAALKKSLGALAADGGGIEIVKVDKEKGIVEIRMTGACCGCPFKQLTFAKNIAEKIKEKFSWAKDIKLIE